MTVNCLMVRLQSWSFEECELLATLVEGDSKAPFLIATTLRCRGFPGLLHFTRDTYLIMLSVTQGGIKYHFLSL